jgi:hypothetical protein
MQPLSPSGAPFFGVRCSDIATTSVSWLWEPYLARGKLAILDGDPGTGKSFATIDLACRVSRGLPMPGASAGAEPAAVLLMNAEDDARDTIRPRVLAAGGDPERLRVFASPGIGLHRAPRFPEDFDALEVAVRQTRAALVVIDPMMAFFPPDVSANNNQAISTALLPFSALAAEAGACVLLVRHLRKGGGAGAIYRGLGSIGILGAARTGLVVSRHPDDPELRVLAPSKTNIGPPGESLGFRLARNDSGQTVVQWAGPLDVTADDLFGAGTPLRAGNRSRERASDWLKQFLAEGENGPPRSSRPPRRPASRSGCSTAPRRSSGLRSAAVKKEGKVEWWWRDPEAARAAAGKERDSLDRALKLLSTGRRAHQPASSSSS